jgi:hypothetical protein
VVAIQVAVLATQSTVDQRVSRVLNSNQLRVRLEENLAHGQRSNQPVVHHQYSSLTIHHS